MFYRILQPSNYKSSGMGSKLSAMGVSGVGTRLVSGGMGGHRNSISFDRSGEFLVCLLFASSIESKVHSCTTYLDYEKLSLFKF